MDEQNLICWWKAEDQAKLSAIEDQSTYLITKSAANITSNVSNLEILPSRASDVLGERVSCSDEAGIFVHNPQFEAVNVSSTDIATLAGKIMNCCQEFRYDTKTKAKYPAFWDRHWYGAGTISSEKHGFNVWKVATHSSKC